MAQDITLGGPKRPTHSIASVKKVWANGAQVDVPIPVDGIEPDDYLINVENRIRSNGVILPQSVNDYTIVPAGGAIVSPATNSTGQDLFITWYDRRQQSPVSVQHGDVAAQSLVLNPLSRLDGVSVLYAWWKPENIGLLGQSASSYFDNLDDEMTVEEVERLKRYAGWPVHASHLVTDQLGLDALNLIPHVPTLGAPGNATKAVNVNGYQPQSVSLATGGAAGTDGSGLDTVITQDFAGAWMVSIVVNPRDAGSGGLWSIEATSLTSDAPPILGEGLNTISSPFAPAANEPYIVTSILRTDTSSKLLVNNLVPVVGNTGANTFTAPETLFLGNVVAPGTPVDNTPDMDWIEIVVGANSDDDALEQYAVNVHDYLLRKYRFKGSVN